MKKQFGHTLVELIQCFIILGILTGIGFGIYAVIHFINKVW